MPTYERMRQLQREQASGELIAATMDLEVHVFLQRGRVAWATSSASRQTFREFLVRECGVAPGPLGQAIEEARRNRTVIGEALVARGLATAEQVRAALRAQVAGALVSLQGASAPSVLFLPREAAFATYDPALTFDLEDVLPHAPAQTQPTRSQQAPQERLQAVLSALPQLRWAEYVEGGKVGARIPSGPASDSPAWHAATFGSGVSQVLLRHDGALLLGVRLAEPRTSLWGRLDDVQGQQVAVAVFAAQGLVAPTSRPTPVPGMNELKSVGTPPADERALRELLAQDGDVRAVALCGRQPAFVLGRASHPLELWQGLVGSRSALFRCADLGPATDTVRSPVVALLDEAGWWFGMPLETPVDATLWVLGRSGLSTGLGLAVVRSLGRRLLRGD